MAHVALEAELGAQHRALLQLREFGLLRGALQLAVAAGVQLDHRRPKRHRRFELARIGLDEKRDADAGVAQPRDHRLQVIVLARGVETALGRPLLALLRHDAGRMRLVLQRDADHLGRGGHLEIERDLELAHQPVDVGVDDVPAILAQVRGDAVGAGCGGDQGRAQRIGELAATRVADGGDVIDVHAETQLWGHGILVSYARARRH